MIARETLNQATAIEKRVEKKKTLIIKQIERDFVCRLLGVKFGTEAYRYYYYRIHCIYWHHP